MWALCWVSEKLLASGSGDMTVRMWNCENGTLGERRTRTTTEPLWKGACVLTIQHPSMVLAVVAVPGGGVASGCYDRKVRCFDSAGMGSSWGTVQRWWGSEHALFPSPQASACTPSLATRSV